MKTYNVKITAAPIYGRERAIISEDMERATRFYVALGRAVRTFIWKNSVRDQKGRKLVIEIERLI